MNALPTLNGSIGYIFTSCDLKGLPDSKSTRTSLRDVVDRFKIFRLPRRMEGKQETWLAGERVDTRGNVLVVAFFLPLPFPVN